MDAACACYPHVSIKQIISLVRMSSEDFVNMSLEGQKWKICSMVYNKYRETVVNANIE